MQTLTVTAARAKLGHWMERAARGEEIGIVVGSQIIALRPVPIQAADYMETEYGMTRSEADRAAATIVAESDRAAAAGDYVTLESFASTHASGKTGKSRGGRARRPAAR